MIKAEARQVECVTSLHARGKNIRENNERVFKMCVRACLHADASAYVIAGVSI